MVTYGFDLRGNLVVRMDESERIDPPRSLEDALEPLTTGEWEWVQPAEIGALTSAPILSREVTRNDAGDVLTVGRVYWYPAYAVNDPLADLVEQGVLRFTLAP